MNGDRELLRAMTRRRGQADVLDVVAKVPELAVQPPSGGR